MPEIRYFAFVHAVFDVGTQHYELSEPISGDDVEGARARLDDKVQSVLASDSEPSKD